MDVYAEHSATNHLEFIGSDYRSAVFGIDQIPLTTGSGSCHFWTGKAAAPAIRESGSCFPTPFRTDIRPPMPSASPKTTLKHHEHPLESFPEIRPVSSVC